MRKSNRAISLRSITDSPEYMLQMAVAGEFDRLPEEVRQALKDLSHESRCTFLSNHFTSLLEINERELITLLNSINPLTLLALLSSASRIRIKNSAPERSIGQVHVELAQFLILTLARPNSMEHPSLEKCSRICALLLDFQLHGLLKRSPALRSDLTGVDAQRKRVAFVTSSYFSTARNWAYPQHIEEVISGLVRPLEDDFCESQGYRLSIMHKMWRSVRQLIFQRLDMIQVLRNAVNCSAHDKIRLALDKATALGMQHLSALLEHATIDSRQSVITAALSDIYIFKLSDFLEHSGDTNLSPTALERYLLDHSMTFGDTASSSLNDALSSNPIWMRPLIAIGEEKFFVGLPEAFEVFIFRHVEEAFSRAGMGSRYEKRRARYLEEKVEAVLHSGLPSATAVKGTKFRHGGIDGENDLLMRLGNWLLIIESKSHKLTGMAQRGASKRLQTKLQELIVNPSVQSMRFAEYLCTRNSTCDLCGSDGQRFRVNMQEISRLLRISVTLEPLGAVAAQTGVVRAMEIAEATLGLSLTINLFDLMTIMDVLSTEVERIDYLFRRLDLQVKASSPFEGEERDLLVFYIASNLRFDGLVDYGVLPLNGFRAHLNDFYFPAIEGRRATRIVRGYTSLWKKLVAFVEFQSAACWPEAAIWLLTLTKEEQRDFERDVRGRGGRLNSVVCRIIEARGWNERAILCMKIKSRHNDDSLINELKIECRHQMDLHNAQHAIIFILERVGDHLHPKTVSVLTRRDNPAWI